MLLCCSSAAFFPTLQTVHQRTFDSSGSCRPQDVCRNRSVWSVRLEISLTEERCSVFAFTVTETERWERNVLSGDPIPSSVWAMLPSLLWRLFTCNYSSSLWFYFVITLISSFLKFAVCCTWLALFLWLTQSKPVTLTRICWVSFHTLLTHPG